MPTFSACADNAPGMQLSPEYTHRPIFENASASVRAALLGVLADGAWHSEEALAGRVDAERARVREQAEKLSRLGLDIESRPGRGIRLSRPLELLSGARIRSEVNASVAARMGRLEVFLELDSTNAHLLGAPAPAAGRLTAVLAEFQHAGRGRRGRIWNMPLGSGIALSVGWTFPETPGDLAALSLAAGVTTRRVIQALCGCAPALKWPNDLIWEHRKLAGILVESAARPQGACHVVVGLGLNVSLDSERLDAVGDQPGAAVDLERMTGIRAPWRSELAARLIEGYCKMFRTFQSSGFKKFHAAFVEADYLRRRRVVVTDGPSRVSGTVMTVDRSGALILDTETGMRRIVAGDVNLKPVR